jgi:ketosteroid isomerase-like protein
MSKENVTIVRNGYDAFRRGDIEVIFDTLDPGVEFYQSEEVPWGGRYQGHKEVGVFFQRLTSTIESKVDPDQFVDSGDRVVAVGYTRGRVRATGKQFEVPAVHVWTLKDGKVVRFEAYIDNPRILPALRP